MDKSREGQVRKRRYLGGQQFAPKKTGSSDEDVVMNQATNSVLESRK